MKSDRERWNKRYQAGAFSNDPSAIVERFHTMAPVGRALDIAAGKGRNSMFLAQCGFDVEALDISDMALTGLKQHRGVLPVCVDFDSFDIPESRYHLIINIRFLHRRLFPQILEALVPGGVLIFETYLMGWDPSHQGEHQKEYMLRKNELLRAFLPLRIVYYREVDAGGGDEDRPLASLVGVKQCET